MCPVEIYAFGYLLSLSLAQEQKYGAPSENKTQVNNLLA